MITEKIWDQHTDKQISGYKQKNPEKINTYENVMIEVAFQISMEKTDYSINMVVILKKCKFNPYTPYIRIIVNVNKETIKNKFK